MIMNEMINWNYDKEMNESELLNFESKLANSNTLNNYRYDKCYLFNKISQSINLVKSRIKSVITNEKKINFSCTKGVTYRFLYRFFQEFL